jgi:hypothetical protein
MDDLTKLASLANLGSTFKDNPLATFSDAALSKELKSRGWTCYESFKLEPLDFELDFDPKALDKYIESTPALFRRYKKAIKR